MAKTVENATIVSNRSLSAEVCELVLKSPQVAREAQAGQFVMVKNENGGTFLRRPFGVADVQGDELTIIYRLVGKGTRELTSLTAGCEVSVEGPLGHGFNLPADGEVLVIGGGVGIAPIIYTARKLTELGNKPCVLLGMRNSSELFWQEQFTDKSAEIFISTDDGSAGHHGFAIDAIPAILEKHDIKHILICGPMVMMSGIAKLAEEKSINCQVSLEKRMACGIGVCLGCTFEGKSGKRWKICADGPVFDGREVF